VNQPDRSEPPQPGVTRRRVLAGLTGVGVAAGAGGLLAACSSPTSSPAASANPSSTAKPSYGGNLQVGMTGGSAQDGLDPHFPVTDVDGARVQSLYEPLVILNAQATGVQYVLAESIEAQNGKADAWLIKLRPGVTFHDGKPLTADDVLFTLNRIHKMQAPGSVFLGNVDFGNTKKLDDLTVLVKLNSPIGDYGSALAAAAFDLAIAPSTLTDPKRPNGTGPFKYTSFAPGQRSVFSRNANYWQKGLPYVDTLTIIDFADTTSLADALTTGQIQAAGTLDPPQIPALDNASGVEVVISKGGSIVPFTMRVDQAPFNDVNVRQAMRLLVNRPQMIDSALDGYGTVASDVFSPFDPDFDHSLIRQQDIPQAKALLRKARQENLTVNLVTGPILSGVVALATVFKEQAQAAGVTVNLVNKNSSFFGPTYLKSTFSQDYYSYFPYLTQVGQCMLPTSPYNETHTGNPGYTKMYNDALATTSTALRKEIVHEMQQYDFNQGGYIVPAYTDTLDAYSTKITGYGPSRLGLPLMSFGFMHFGFTA
jgi:peptide/nickel transport system substrate-binding protein